MDYAVKSLQGRDITPRSAIFMKQYKEQVSDALVTSTDEDRVAFIGGVLVIEHLLNKERFPRSSPTADIKQLQELILALRELEYFSTYGDFPKTIPKKHASSLT